MLVFIYYSIIHFTLSNRKKCCPLVFCVCTYVNPMICYVMNKFLSRPWKVILRQCGGSKFQKKFPFMISWDRKIHLKFKKAVKIHARIAISSDLGDLKSKKFPGLRPWLTTPPQKKTQLLTPSLRSVDSLRSVCWNRSRKRDRSRGR